MRGDPTVLLWLFAAFMAACLWAAAGVRRERGQQDHLASIDRWADLNWPDLEDTR